MKAATPLLEKRSRIQKREQAKHKAVDMIEVLILSYSDIM